ncbi:MAG: hypothetical protein WA744_00680 [Candidatus Acidiferrales bacterium]
MWNYLIGPILALLPRPWRDSLPIANNQPWGRAGAISGLGESLAALVALGYWYMYAMSTWVDTAVSRALDGKLGPNVTVQEIGSVALMVWMTHPLTLLLGYLILEGMVRFLAAAFGEESLGILQLGVLDFLLVRPFLPRNALNDPEAGGTTGNAGSFLDALREAMWKVRGVPETHELHFRNDGDVELMEIRASHRKHEWIPPRTVRFEDAYYRLEASSVKNGPRPYYYTLRRLPSGVPGRSVLIYAPVDAPTRE